MLLVGAGLLTRSFLSLLKTDPGFNPDHVLTMNLVLPAAKYKDDPSRAAFYTDLVQRVKAQPGVESAAMVNYIPLGGANSSDAYLIEGEPEPQPGDRRTTVVIVSPRLITSTRWGFQLFVAAVLRIRTKPARRRS